MIQKKCLNQILAPIPLEILVITKFTILFTPNLMIKNKKELVN